MRAIIIEDEARAASRLSRLIATVADEVDVIQVYESIREMEAYLDENEWPDVIFSDIQLADGLSFDLYERRAPKCPVIFTTAYDQYAIKAFKTNGIDYLLKPIEEGELEVAINKLRSMIGQIKEESQLPSMDDLMALASQLRSPSNEYRGRFTVKVGKKLKSIEVKDLSAIYSENKGTYLLTFDGRTHLIDHSVDRVEAMMDPSRFFRINRSHIVSMGGVEEMVIWSNSRLKLHIKGSKDEDIIVARDRTKEFKEWMDR